MLQQPYDQIMAAVKARIIGQPEALAAVTRALRIIQAGIREPGKPLAVMMFAGPTGTGKSELAELLADVIHGDREQLCRIDCNLLSEAHMVTSLSGAPPSYVGSDKESTLLIPAKYLGSDGRPGILVFEEIEKAHSRIWDTLLGVFDKGRLASNNGQLVHDFSNTIIIMTSNLGAADLARAAGRGRQPAGFAAAKNPSGPPASAAERQHMVRRQMDATFRPEFINRIDDVVVFSWLSRRGARRIVDIMLADLTDRVELRTKCIVAYDEAVARYVVARGFSMSDGARSLKRAVRREVEDYLAEVLADERREAPYGIRLGVGRRGHLTHRLYSLTPPEMPRPRLADDHPVTASFAIGS